jgi:hypothetical protein
VHLSLFVEIVNTCKEKSCYLKRMRNAAGLLGLTRIKLYFVVMRVLAYGIPFESTDEG